MALAPGDTVGRFTVRARLGAGGMGDVYCAYDPQLDREVALKILHREPTDPASAALLREARAAASLDHPNVISVFEVGEASTDESARTPYMTMELVSGRSLKGVVGDEAIGVPAIVGWLVDVARALGFAHRRGLVHGDVKPSNVMLRDDGHIKLLDFGIARRPRARNGDATTQTDTRSSTVSAVPDGAGTPAYMAPEQLLGEPLDGRTDQFAWAVMAYELLTGVRPWASSGQPVHLAAEILSRAPPPPSTANPRVPEPISRVVMRALSKARDERFATMEDLATLLVAAAADAGGSAAIAPPSPSAGRSRRVVIAVGAGACAALVALVVVVVASREGAAVAQSSVASSAPSLPSSSPGAEVVAPPSTPTSSAAAAPGSASPSALPSASSSPAPSTPRPSSSGGKGRAGAVDPQGRPIFW